MLSKTNNGKTVGSVSMWKPFPKQSVRGTDPTKKAIPTHPF